MAIASGETQIMIYAIKRRLHMLMWYTIHCWKEENEPHPTV